MIERALVVVIMAVSVAVLVEMMAVDRLWW